MTGGKATKILNILNDDKYRIFSKIEPVVVTPTELHKARKVPVKNRFSFVITAMSSSDLARLKAYRSKAKAITGIEYAMSKVGLSFLDLYNYSSMEEYRKATIEQRLENMNEANVEIVNNQMKNDIEAQIEAEILYEKGKESAILACTNCIRLGDEDLEFSEELIEPLCQEYRDWLYNEILENSTLTEDELTALR
jgi:hypothetical protein